MNTIKILHAEVCSEFTEIDTLVIKTSDIKRVEVFDREVVVFYDKVNTSHYRTQSTQGIINLKMNGISSLFDSEFIEFKFCKKRT